MMYYYLLCFLHPPTLPLVPYTTLFRSRDEELRIVTHGESAHVHVPQPDVPGVYHVGLWIEGAYHCDCCAVGRGGDRKSTRLNSSHLVISYAVFCLKKKKSCLDVMNIK